MGILKFLNKFDEKIEKIEKSYDNKTDTIKKKIDDVYQYDDQQTYSFVIAGVSATKYALKGTKKGLQAVIKGKNFKDEFKKNFKVEYIEDDVEQTLNKINKARKKENPVRIAKKPISVLKKISSFIRKCAIKWENRGKEINY